MEKDNPPSQGSGEARPNPELFNNLFLSNRPRVNVSRVFMYSLVAHVVVLVLLVLGPIMWPSDPLPQTNYINVLLYDPPPPPPPPMLLGSSAGQQVKPSKPVTPVTKPDKERPVLDEPRKEERPDLEPSKPDTIQAGSETGSLNGVAEGMEDGVEGGQVGGVPGGVLGGVVGGTGDVVMDFDQPPRLIRQTKPVYPHEAFLKHLEGVVIVEVVLDAGGQIRSARVIQSIPLLDEAALQCVWQWTFAPAIKHGKPVATIIHAPIKFRIE